MILSRLQNIDLKYRISLLFFKCWHNHSGSGLVCCQYLSSASFSSHSFQGVCKGVRHGALTTSQFFPVAWSGDNFVILASLHLLCTWKLVLLLFVGFFSEILFKVCHLIHGTSVSLVLLFSLVEIFLPSGKSQPLLKGQVFCVLPESNKYTSTRLSSHSSQRMLKVG